MRLVTQRSANACVIHYTQNDQLLQPGELLLIDAGCEYSHYASDITRTFPVSGRFTEPQKDLYQAVLNVQKKCIDKCTVADEIGMNELHRLSKPVIGICRAPV
jgi:intermediate cleaving peptidase 55